MGDKIKPGQRWLSVDSGVVLVLGKKASGNGHWNTHKQGKRGKIHRIHEGTLRRFYRREKADG